MPPKAPERGLELGEVASRKKPYGDLRSVSAEFAVVPNQAIDEAGAKECVSSMIAKA